MSAQNDAPRFSLMQVLTSPSTAFAALADHPKPPFFLVYILAGLCAIPLAYVSTVLAIDIAQQQLAGLPPEAATVAKTIGMASAAIGAIFGPFIVGFILTLVAMLIGLFVGGGVKFRQYFSMLGYAGIPSAIGGLIQGLLSMGATNLADLQQVSLSAAAFLPAGSNGFLLAVAGLLNPFTLWYLFLATIGFAALHRIKPAKGAIFTGTLVLFQTLAAYWGSSQSIPQ